MDYLHALQADPMLGMALAGSIGVLLGSFNIIRLAWKANWKWGLASITIPFAVFVFVLRYLPSTWRSVVFVIACYVVYGYGYYNSVVMQLAANY